MEEAIGVVELEDINALYALIRRDPNFLENIDRIPFVDTPLHAAAKTGNTDVVIEIMRLKPSFATKLNPEGYSPMHLALQSGQTQTVLQLLLIDPELVRVKGRAGITPLHYASEKGDIYLLTRFLSVCPKSVEAVTNQGETALHMALKNDKVEAFEVLTRRPPWLGGEEAQYCNKRIFNWKDKDGNTLLHIATSKNQFQVVRCLLDRKVEVNPRNLDGLTPLDIILDQIESRNEEIENMLRNAEALEATSLPIIDNYTHSLRTDQGLNEAAQVGNVDALYELILEDAYLLDRIDQVPFIDTPLHIAASAGNIQFALEIMRLKPSFARKQNRHGFTPMHLALQNEQTQMVLRFLDVDRKLVRVQGREGKTSLHYAAEKGNVGLLSEFLVTCPESIKDVTIRKETALHIAVENNKLEVLDILLNWLQYVGMHEILMWTDDKGNTLLHIAISRSHIQMVRLLLASKVERTVRNSAGLTALDVLEDQLQSQPEFEEMKRIVRASHSCAGYCDSMLRRACAVKRTSHPVVDITDSLREKVTCFQKIRLYLYRSSMCITNENRDAVLVVAVLIATATYQAALTPSAVIEGSGKTDSTFNNEIVGEESYALPYGSSHLSPTVIKVLRSLFLVGNVAAFSISMLVIRRNLPNGTSTSLLAASFITSSNRRFMKVSASILKHYRSFRNEMTANATH
ncbi:Ankyrin repeat-containing protein [Melia azedarach]|uniref:Ankyrin repeat-containing protein n=1 Tax=Melia azedarach TaxID=155640 RepID=A0ACC1YTA5_MELAZ|nr:Ankyrin repeat-containing protein [Melia azedarach]